MRRGRLARLAVALAVGVLAVVVFNSLYNHGLEGPDGSDGSAGAATAGTGRGGVPVASRWDTRLDLLSDRAGDCQVPSGTACGTLMEDVTVALSGLDDDLGAAESGTGADYSDAQADITRLQGNISDYDAANCPQPVVLGAAAPSASCQVDSTMVTAGIFPLRAELDADESGAK